MSRKYNPIHALTCVLLGGTFLLAGLLAHTTRDCKQGYHKFEPRFDKGSVTRDDLDACQKLVTDVVQFGNYERADLVKCLIEDIPQREYVCDVCVVCGKITQIKHLPEPEQE